MWDCEGIYTVLTQANNTMIFYPLTPQLIKVIAILKF